MAAEAKEQTIDLTPGAEYHHWPWVCRDGRYVRGSRPTTYRVLCQAKNGRTGQDSVVYEGLDGRDAGQIFVCSLGDFAGRFTPVPRPEPPAAEPPKPVPPELANWPMWPMATQLNFTERIP